LIIRSCRGHQHRLRSRAGSCIRHLLARMMRRKCSVRLTALRVLLLVSVSTVAAVSLRERPQNRISLITRSGRPSSVLSRSCLVKPRGSSSTEKNAEFPSPLIPLRGGERKGVKFAATPKAADGKSGSKRGRYSELDAHDGKHTPMRSSGSQVSPRSPMPSALSSVERSHARWVPSPWAVTKAPC
jgi:hypothetical protein